jgi:putative FmdB family regulatory protein
MPVYEYACGKCGHELEAEQRITDPPLKLCPRCRARRLKRLISQTSFVLKGGGWYADLYASKAAKDKPETAPEAGEAKSDAAAQPEAPAASAPAADSGKDAPKSPPKPKREGKRGKRSKAAA